MLEKLKAQIVFERLLGRPDISKAYAMVKPEDSWYETISTVHKSLAEIKQLPHEILEIVSHDGLKLKAVFYPGNSDKTVIWIHGYTSHAERESAFPGLFYHSLGYNVLVPYLRAHGLSEGKYLSFGPMECQDLLKWVDKINEQYPTGSILVHGISMGGGIVLDAATIEMENVKCMIADAPCHCISSFFEDVIGGAFKRNQKKILCNVYDRFQKEFSCGVTEFNRLQNIKEGKYPLLLSAGSNEALDGVLSVLKENNPKPTSVLILPGCNHGNGMYKQTELYQTAIREFLDLYIGI